MSLVIALVVSLCGNVSMSDVAKKKAELEHQFPTAKISVRVDKKACAK
jgi:hypothetical protein